jgi:lysozyme
MKTTFDVVVDLCVQFEGFRGRPYLCPAGYATLGYGSIYRPSGERVTLNDAPITQAQALDWLRLDLVNHYLPDTAMSSPVLMSYPQTWAAVTDFVYNLGIGRYRASTLKRRVDRRDWGQACVELARWVRGDGRVLPGLVKRRAAEIALIKKETQ